MEESEFFEGGDRMRVDSVEFEESLSSTTMVSLNSMVWDGSVVRQSAHSIGFDPDEYGMTKISVVGDGPVVSNNNLGGGTLSDLEILGMSNIYPEALSVVVPNGASPFSIASSMVMREEMLLKRMLDGSRIDGEIREDWIDDHNERVNMVDLHLSGIIDKIGCTSQIYDPSCCPLILFDSPLIASQKAPMIRRTDIMTNQRFPDAMVTSKGKRCRMYSFPNSPYDHNHPNISEIPKGADEAPEFFSVYVIEPSSLYMIESAPMQSGGMPENDSISIIMWVVGFLVKANGKVHRIKVFRGDRR